MRAPLVLGLDARVGTSTIAAGLHAQDGGQWDTAPANDPHRHTGGGHTGGGAREAVGGRRADIVVCGSDADALGRAGALLLDPYGAHPVLAVAGEAPRARLRALEVCFGTVVVLPQVARWRGLTHPLDEVGHLLGQPAEHLPHALRAYVGALRLLTAAVVSAGRLTGADAPWVSRPRPAELWRGLAPVERRPQPPGSVRPWPGGPCGRARSGAAERRRIDSAPPDDLDDDALEALIHAGRTPAGLVG